MRLGLVVRGSIYFFIGLFGLEMALGLRSGAANFTDVIIAASRQSGARVVLGILIVGLSAYSLWGVLKGVFNVLNKKKDWMGYATRVGYLASAVSYGILAWGAYELLVGGAITSASGNPSSYGQKIIAFPFGREVLMVVGICWILGAVAQGVGALREGFKQELKLRNMGEWQKKLGLLAGKLGLLARAVVFGLIGLFVFKAAMDWNLTETKGVGEVLNFLVEQTFGPIIVIVLSGGLGLMGMFSIFTARYGKISME